MDAQVWITAYDIMTIAKIYNLNYAQATDKIRELVEAENKEAVFAE
jgi:hypothetical protein